jgi:hypothetical protein
VACHFQPDAGWLDIVTVLPSSRMAMVGWHIVTRWHIPHWVWLALYKICKTELSNRNLDDKRIMIKWLSHWYLEPLLHRSHGYVQISIIGNSIICWLTYIGHCWAGTHISLFLILRWWTTYQFTILHQIGCGVSIWFVKDTDSTIQPYPRHLGNNDLPTIGTGWIVSWHYAQTTGCLFKYSCTRLYIYTHIVRFKQL